MAGATIAPSLPAIERHFAGTEGAALLTRLVLTAPALTIAILGPALGWATDRFGRRPVLLASAVAYAFAGTAGYALDSLEAIIASRAALGIAVGGVMTASTTYIGDLFEGSARDAFLGVQAAFMGLGGVVFLLAAGALADASWRYPFLIYALSLPLVAPILLTLPGRMTALTGPARDEQAPVRIPKGSLFAVYTLAVLGCVAFYLLPTQLPFLLEALGEASPSASGEALAAMTLSASIASLLYGRICRRIGIRGTFVACFLLSAAGCFLVARADDFAGVVMAMAVAGPGVGLMMPNLSVAALAAAPPAARGRVVGGLTTAMFLGQFLSPLVTQHAGEVHGWAATFAGVGVGLGALALLCLPVRSDR